MKPLILLFGAAVGLGSLSAQSSVPPPANSPAETPAALASAGAAVKQQPIPRSYQEYIALLIRPENVAECVAVMDRVIDTAEAEAAKGAPYSAKGRTSLGLDFDFRRSETGEAMVYRLVFFRGGEPMPFSDAVKFVALFADRAGLLHPVDVQEGERPIFYSQWLIKSTEWKNIQPKMMALRTANRAEKDVMKAFAVAVTREIDARKNFNRGARPIK